MSAEDIIGSLRGFNLAHRVPLRARGSRNGRAVLTEEQVREIRRMIAQGVRPKVIMRRFPQLTRGNYDAIAARKTWRHV